MTKGELPMSLAGTYDCTIRTPLGEQKGTLTVVPDSDGTGFTGSLTNPMMGTMPIESGMISGNTLIWNTRISAPMPMDVNCRAAIEGDRLTGTVKAGMFGSLPLSGHRAG